jgi:hypothetical protein
MNWDRNGWVRAGQLRAFLYRRDSTLRPEAYLTDFIRNMQIQSGKDSLCAYMRGFDEGAS